MTASAATATSAAATAAATTATIATTSAATVRFTASVGVRAFSRSRRWCDGSKHATRRGVRLSGTNWGVGFGLAGGVSSGLPLQVVTMAKLHRKLGSYPLN